MSVASSFVAPSSGAVPGLPIPSRWSNPLPENYNKVENRTIILENEHRVFLEMHREGTRGVLTTTEFTVLNIITAMMSIPPFRWTAFTHEKPVPASGNLETAGTKLVHFIQGTATGLFLCMDNNSIIYQSRTASSEHCSYHNEQDHKHSSETYYRQINDSMPKWYIGLNKHGLVQCGNTTRKKDRTFFRTEKIHNFSKSPPFVKNTYACCQKRCDNRKQICDIMRRSFFKLKLKDLKKYYKKCVITKNRNDSEAKRNRKKNRNARNRRHGI